MEKTQQLDVQGMHCAACAMRIEKAVGKMDGVSNIQVNLATEKGSVTFQDNRTSLEMIIERINKIGFYARRSSSQLNTEQEKKKELRSLRWQFTISLLLTLPLAWAMLDHFEWAAFIYVPAIVNNPLFQLALTIPIQFVIGQVFYERAWKGVRQRSMNMDVLVVLSTSAAFFYSHYLTFATIDSKQPNLVFYYETSAFIITFILLGKLLEGRTKLKTTASIKKLYALQSDTATVYTNGKQKQTSVTQLIPGDIILVKPGEKIPIDGQVINGNSMVDESLLTGESMPKEICSGNHVYAGTINQIGSLKVLVTKKADDNTLTNIIRIVEEAQNVKAPIQQLADKITGVFVPIVLGIAALTFIAWYFLVDPGHFNIALERMMAVLIIACPCALGLATPTSVMVGSGRAAQQGVLFKEGQFLELLGKCNVVLFDKTGTLTKGEPMVSEYYTYGISDADLFAYAGAVENESTHPLSRAIVKEASAHHLYLPDATHVESIPGYGVKGVVSGKTIMISSPRFKAHTALPKSAAELIQKLESEGKTVMIVFVNEHFSGVIAVEDALKSNAAYIIRRLGNSGRKVCMLSGDHQEAVRRIARKTGIQHFQAGVTPQMKSDIIKKMQSNGDTVAMVGDGMNDAPALAVADVGIALGTGSDIAINAGDVTIVNGNLNQLIDAIAISGKTMQNIKQNFAWAFLYNILMIPLAIIGFLPPWIAAAAMAFSSVTVVLNALRLKKIKLSYG